MPLTPDALAELSAQETGTAWLVLITLDHADLNTPIRVTSDRVETLSQGNLFSPFPFEVTLPDDVEGRTPRAELRIDNTTQEIIALLRGLTTPPVLTIQIVRSADPDVIEREWVGIELAVLAIRRRRDHRHADRRRSGDRGVPLRHLRRPLQGAVAIAPVSAKSFPFGSVYIRAG